MVLGIIAGSGFKQILPIQNPQKITVKNRFGEAICLLGDLKGRKIVFLWRHGEGHKLPPHKINYRANVMAMKQLGVRAVLATAATGTLRRTLPVGTLLVPNQLLDWTKQRPLTLFEGDDAPLVHIDFTQPFCPTLRQKLLQAAKDLEIQIVEGGCYVCSEGPRYETAFEVKMLAQLGGDVAGMTAGTEAVLFREAEICYAIIAVVTNWGAGLSQQPLTHSEVEAMMKEKMPAVAQIFEHVIANFEFRDCTCLHSLDSYGEDARRWLSESF
ncbi:MAG: S-methyl-5'-thioinosine phosphorylase [Armatimonadetes bacterium]|nr:S-methyl-5'-thioinosine phosphorylase [Armatimonadota bacterium]MDW8027937.1 S-methyl-5'-thioinosine phosphorylase [Armatimonadota bacterium]